MALYDYSCPRCGLIEVAHSMYESRLGRICPSCASPIEPRISVSIATASFSPYIEYNLGKDPEYITSAKQLDRIAESKGLAVHGTYPGKKRWTQDNTWRGPNTPKFPRLRKDHIPSSISIPDSPT